MNKAVCEYLVLARVGHWVKHVFIIPGAVLALLLVGRPDVDLMSSIPFGLASACLMASANYVMNGWLDRGSDVFHPLKKDRPSVTGRVSRNIVYGQYVILVALGVYLASLVSVTFLVTAVIFLCTAIIYNVPPLRFKDYAVLDVLVESLNNPLRLMMGWALVSASTIPPASLLVSYWLGGAFLMAAKRLAEYNLLQAQDLLGELKRYRRSFVYYTERSLLISCFSYGLLASFFSAAFLIKYRDEYLFLFPFLSGLFAYYLWLAIDPEKSYVVQNPESMYRDKRLMILLVVIVFLSGFLTFVDVPLAEYMTGYGRDINYIPWR